MGKRLGFALGGTLLAFAMGSCFMVQSFAILDYTLTPGQATKAKFVLRPSNFDQEVAGISGPQYEFVVVGVETDDDLNVQTATWGTNGEFGGPMTMPANGALLTAMASSCSWAGLSFSDITGYTWKLFVTPVEIGDGNKFEKEAVVQVGVKAKGTATAGNEPSVIGVAGEWADMDDNDTPSGEDFYLCEGIESASVHIKAA